MCRKRYRPIKEGHKGANLFGGQLQCRSTVRESVCREKIGGDAWGVRWVSHLSGLSVQESEAVPSVHERKHLNHQLVLLSRTERRRKSSRRGGKNGTQCRAGQRALYSAGDSISSVILIFYPSMHKGGKILGNCKEGTGSVISPSGGERKGEISAKGTPRSIIRIRVKPLHRPYAKKTGPIGRGQHPPSRCSNV